MPTGIEWPGGPTSSTMSVDVLPAGTPDIVAAHLPCNVNIQWTVPPPFNTIIGGSFQLRAYVESIGPGPEKQIGPTITVPVVFGQINYTSTIPVLANTLLGEGDIDPSTGQPVSGVYEIVAVLQQLNPGPTIVTGFAEDTLTMFRSP